MIERRTDLAVEAKELWEETADEETLLHGVRATEKHIRGFPVTEVKILDERGEKELCKPKGTYVTVELDSFIRRDDDAFSNGASAISAVLKEMMDLDSGDTVLVVGLGNKDITPDAVGPKTVENTLVTRHLVDSVPEHFGSFRKVSAVETGVLGTTGIESVELIKAVAEKVKPDCILAVDALASRKLGRVCRTVQISDTGIVPGSGVGNGRAAVNQETVGSRVIALGVPTVVDAATLTADLMEQADIKEADREKLQEFGGDMIVTPKEIDSRVSDISRLVGYGINLALQDGLTVEDIDMFMG